MNKHFWLLLGGACIVGFGSVAYGGSIALDASKRGLDHTGQYTEQPTVKYTGAGDVSIRFAADKSPVLAKWRDGRITMNCPIGYRFKVEAGTGSEHSGMGNEQATCVRST